MPFYKAQDSSKLIKGYSEYNAPSIPRKCYDDHTVLKLCCS